jgi:hypothetical protein
VTGLSWLRICHCHCHCDSLLCLMMRTDVKTNRSRPTSAVTTALMMAVTVASLQPQLLLLPSSPFTTFPGGAMALSFTAQPTANQRLLLPRNNNYNPMMAYYDPSTSDSSSSSPQSSRRTDQHRLMMISTGDDRSERKSLDISTTTYTSLIKSPKDAYQAVSDDESWLVISGAFSLFFFWNKKKNPSLFFAPSCVSPDFGLCVSA